MKFPNQLKRSPSSSPPSSSPPSPGGGGGAAAASSSTPPTSPSKKLFSLSGRTRTKKLNSPPEISEPHSSSNPPFSFSSSSTPSPRSHPHGNVKSSSTASDHPSGSSSSSPLLHTHAGKGKAFLTSSDQRSISLSLRHLKGDTAESSINEIKQVFAQFDANGDGKISSEERRAVLTLLGDETTSEEAALMVREVDPEGKGYLNLEEFVQLNERCLHGATEEEEMKAVFEIFDIDKNGWISAEELQAVLRRLGGGLAQRTSVEDCKRMIRGVDRKGMGRVDFDDFMRMMPPLTI